MAAAPSEAMAAGENAESRERLIVATPAAEANLDVPLELDEPLPMQPSPMESKVESLPPADVEVTIDEPVEEAPVSSRRAVVVEPQERLAQMAFGSEEPSPRHTPPPESGRLPAVTADAGDITGVREASSLPQPAPPVARPLSADVIQARLSPSDAVAQVVSDAQAFAPPTFVALLDASLAL